MSAKRLLIAAQAVFVLLFIALAASNFSLRHRLDQLQNTKVAQQSRFFEGDVIPRFEARDRAQRPVALSGAAQAGRVMVMFIPGCDACESVLAQIAAKPSPNVTVVSLMSQKLAASAAKGLSAGVPLYFIDDIHRSSLQSRARVVPQILRLGADGKVAEVCQTYQACVEHLAGG
jgi:hypothetical protein